MKREDWEGIWQGQTVACIASGPSLTKEDCDAVRAAGWKTIVTNTTFRLCPWADVLFGADGSWWREYSTEIAATFHGKRVTSAPSGKTFQAETMHGQTWISTLGNSGATAIVLAGVTGAARIVLLGYDCQKTAGKDHWHGDHPKHLGNARTMPNWPRQFKIAAKTVGIA